MLFVLLLLAALVIVLRVRRFVAIDTLIRASTTGAAGTYDRNAC